LLKFSTGKFKWNSLFQEIQRDGLEWVFESSPLITRVSQSSLSKERIRERLCFEARVWKSSLAKERIKERISSTLMNDLP
jgi:hypothetical protein